MEDLLATAGVRVCRTPAAAPNCNAHAERFVRSFKEDCLNRIDWVSGIFGDSSGSSWSTITVSGFTSGLGTSSSTVRPFNERLGLFVAVSESAGFSVTTVDSCVATRSTSELLDIRHQDEYGPSISIIGKYRAGERLECG